MQRRQSGSAIAESSSSLAVLLPLLVIVTLVTIQGTSAYVIHASLTAAALEAAHDIGSVWAAQNQPGQPLTNDQQQAVFNAIIVPHLISANNSSQSNPNFLPAQFNFSDSPPTVTSHC